LYLHFWQRGNKFRVKGQKGKLRDTERNEDFSTENSRGGNCTNSSKFRLYTATDHSFQRRRPRGG